MTAKPEILTKAPPIPPGSQPDEVMENGRLDLDGLELRYAYSSGRNYKATFYDDRFTFVPQDHSVPAVTLPYYAVKLRPGQVLVHFLVPERSGHVALVIDLDNRTITGSGLLPGLVEQLDIGQIADIVGRGEHY